MTNIKALKVHLMFFKEFASKTWTSISGILSELVANSFDEDTTSVVITLLDERSIVMEDDAGMDETALEKFLLVGSPHKQEKKRIPLKNDDVKDMAALIKAS